MLCSVFWQSHGSLTETRLSGSYLISHQCLNQYTPTNTAACIVLTQSCFPSECPFSLDPQWFSLKRSGQLSSAADVNVQIGQLTPNGSLKALEPLYRGFGIETSVGLVLPPTAPSSPSFCHRGNNRKHCQLLAGQQ